MKKFLATVLLVLLMQPLNLTSQTLQISVSDWMMLRQELANSMDLLNNLDLEIANLKSSLKEAENLQINSKNLIEDLQMQLKQAEAVRKLLEITVSDLENQLAELSISLTDTQNQLDQNEIDHVKSIENMVKIHERQIRVFKAIAWILGIVAAGEAAYIGVQVLKDRS